LPTRRKFRCFRAKARQILEPLVGEDPADEEKVGAAVPEHPRNDGARLGIQVGRELHEDRKDAGALEAEGRELLSVELRIPQREVAGPGEARKLPAPVSGDRNQLVVVSAKELGR
jgi:hypothetical protein